MAARLGKGQGHDGRAHPHGQLDPIAQRHREQLLRLLQSRRTIGQAELIEEADASRRSVADMLDRLKDAKVIRVENASSAPSPEGGRPRNVIRLNRDGGWALGIDIGHEHIRGAVGGLDGHVLDDGEDRWIHSDEVDVDVDIDIENALETAISLAKKLVGTSKRPIGQLVGVTVGVPAPVRDPRSGLVAFDEGMSHWRGVKPAEELRKRLDWDVPFLTENDANLGALAERRNGAARAGRNVVYVKWSTGIGGGLVVGSVIQRGNAGLAGEIGHIKVPGEVDEAPDCTRCGSARCVEALAGGKAVVARVNERLGHQRCASLIDVCRLARSGSEGAELASDQLARAAAYLGRGLVPVVTMLNPAAIVLGGQIAGSADSLPYGLVAPALLEALRDQAWGAFGPSLDDLDVVIGERRWAAAEGAVLHALEHEFVRFASVRMSA
jgi:predicted NBD/HSP70 family sugar kinase